MGELQGSRRSCRAHLSMFTEPGAFIQQQGKRPDGGHPVPNESHCHSVPDMHKSTRIQSHKVRKVTNILCVYAPTFLSVIIIDVLGLKLLILFYGLIAGCLCAGSNKPSCSAQILHLQQIHFI